MEHRVQVTPEYRLWAQDQGSGTPLVLVMGANSSSAAWPDELVSRLSAQHRVIRYDHRDTGRSSAGFDEHPYGLTDLAADVVKLLDALEIPAAHLVGMSMGGYLVQLLLLDHPERVLSGTIFATTALGSWEDESLPGPDPRLLELWEHLGDERGPEAKMAFRLQHWRMLNGAELPFDEQEFRDQEQRVIEHAGNDISPTAHARANQDGLDRGAELATVQVPVLVLEAPEDPINPQPNAQYIAERIAGAQLVRIPGMGHALPRVVLEPLADALLSFTAEVDKQN
jgi:pimeloyl-ACP methyl ester carboxylesterase